VKFEAIKFSVDSETTSNPELENSFSVKRELVIVAVLETTEKRTMLEVSLDLLISIEWPVKYSESAFKNDFSIEIYSPTAERVSRN